MTTSERSWSPSRVVTLLTDFGLDDPYVGILKGVLLQTAHERKSGEELLHIVDLGHGIPAQDVFTAAFQLCHSWRWFPPGTVHVCVVDPGVGTERPILVARRGQHVFLAPDNGVLGPVLEGGDGQGSDDHVVVRHLDVDQHGLQPRSRTFHGRDVFAPLAARLAISMWPAEVGPVVETWQRLTFPTPEVSAEGIRAEVLCVDRFGNLVTNVPDALLGDQPGSWEAEVGGRIVPVRETYAEAGPGDLLALVDSFERVEIAVRDGSAARELALGRGAAVQLRRRR